MQSTTCNSLVPVLTNALEQGSENINSESVSNSKALPQGVKTESGKSHSSAHSTAQKQAA